MKVLNLSDSRLEFFLPNLQKIVVNAGEISSDFLADDKMIEMLLKRDSKKFKLVTTSILEVAQLSKFSSGQSFMIEQEAAEEASKKFMEELKIVPKTPELTEAEKSIKNLQDELTKTKVVIQQKEDEIKKLKAEIAAQVDELNKLKSVPPKDAPKA